MMFADKLDFHDIYFCEWTLSMSEVRLDLAPEPHPSSAFLGGGCRTPAKVRSQVEIEKVIQALEDNEPIEPFLGPDDHAMRYGTMYAPLYGMNDNLLNYAIIAEIKKWFAVLFVDRDGSVCSVVDAAQNPYQAAVTMSAPTSRSKKPVTVCWFVKSIIGPFETQADVVPVLVMWRSVRASHRYEKSAEIANHFGARYFLGSANDIK